MSEPHEGCGSATSSDHTQHKTNTPERCPTITNHQSIWIYLEHLGPRRKCQGQLESYFYNSKLGQRRAAQRLKKASELYAQSETNIPFISMPHLQFRKVIGFCSTCDPEVLVAPCLPAPGRGCSWSCHAEQLPSSFGCCSSEGSTPDLASKPSFHPSPCSWTTKIGPSALWLCLGASSSLHWALKSDSSSFALNRRTSEHPPTWACVSLDRFLRPSLLWLESPMLSFGEDWKESKENRVHRQKCRRRAHPWESQEAILHQNEHGPLLESSPCSVFFPLNPGSLACTICGQDRSRPNPAGGMSQAKRGGQCRGQQ